MFTVRYYNLRMFASRYFPKVGGTAPPAELPYQGDAYYYDADSGIGSIHDGEQLPPETIYA